MVPDIVIVPVLGFDKQCRRIGYGGGFYDRTLQHMERAIKIGVAYSF